MGALFPVPSVLLVTDRHLCGTVDALVLAVAAAIDGGVNAVQLREKDLTPDELLPLVRHLRDVTRGRALLLVNGSLEVALACGADGVHLPETAPMIERSGHPFLVGRSVHSLAAGERAWAACADYLIAGPVYETRSHPGSPAAGVELIEAIAKAVTIPALAIGGITAERVENVMGAGASGVAVISAILAASSPRDAAQKLRREVDTAWSEREAQISIILNGKPQEIKALQTISALLDSLNINGRQVAVAINGDIVTRDVWTKTVVIDGDAVEIVRAVGGG